VDAVNLIDTNVILALTLSNHALHEAARKWFAAATSPKSVLLCRATQQSTLRLLTTEKLMRIYGLPAMSNAAAWDLMGGYFGNPTIGWANEPNGIESAWQRYASRNTPSPKLWMDAYLAAFAYTAGHTLITTDHAFTQFRGLNHLILA
jgi:toxin-antitoxin system PIN domain toxin